MASTPPPTKPLNLNDVYDLVGTGALDQAVDLLFDHVDTFLLEGEYLQVDTLIQALNLKRLDTSVIISLLAMVKPAAGHLPSHNGFVHRVEEHLQHVVPDRVTRLLDGLR